MAIEFICHQCRCELRVKDEDAGKKARCPRCGMVHEVPRETVEVLETASADQETVYQHQSMHSVADGLADDPAKTWSLKTPDGQIFGPVPRSELNQWAYEGRVSGQCLVQMNGDSHWQSALALFPQLASAHDPTQTRNKAHEYATGAAPVYGRQHQRITQARPNNGVAIFVMGILGLVFMALPVFALIALIMGSSERKAMARGEATHDNRWMVDIGFALGLIGTVLGCLTVFGCCFAVNL